MNKQQLAERVIAAARNVGLTFHSGHWDSTGGHGSGCPECQRESGWFWSLQEALIAYDDDGWQPIETAPRDGTFVWVWAAPRDTLPGFVELARYHEDAGWCVDELREVTLWQPCEVPAPPRSEKDEPR